MRYAWDQFDAYFGPEQVGRLRSRLLRPVLARLARWDAATAGRVDRFVANSQYVAGRIRRYYNRGSTVVYPPVDTAFYRPADSTAARPANRRFLVVSALVPYKRIDVAIEACRLAGAPLRIVGRGPEEARLRGSWPARRRVPRLADGRGHPGFCTRARPRCCCPASRISAWCRSRRRPAARPVVALAQGGACETV